MSTLPATLTWKPILAIVPAGEAECQCIAVSHPSRCYVTQEGIVTHNTDTGTAADLLPEKPKAFLDALLAGDSPAQAAEKAGLPIAAASEVANNLGKFLATQWNAGGVDQETALRQLAQRSAESSLLASGPRPSPMAAIEYNHIDRATSKAIGEAINAARSTKPSIALEEALTKLWKAPNMNPAREALAFVRKQLTPLHMLAPEANALMQEMRIKQAFAQEIAMDVGRSVTQQAKFSDIAWPKDLNTPHHHKRVWLAMTGETDMAALDPRLQKIATHLRELLVKAGEHAVTNGRMSADTFQALTETYLPHYYAEEAEGTIAGMVRKFKLGLQDINAQRSTAWHIVDTAQMDPTGQPKIIPWSDNGKRWRFNSEEHRNGFFHDLVINETYKALQSRRESSLRQVSRDDLLKLEKLPEETRGRVKEIMKGMRERFDKRAPLTTEQQEKAGLIMDPVYATMRYVAQMEHDNATADLFNAFNKDSNITRDTPALDHEQIPDHPRFGSLAGKYVQKELAEQILEMVGTPDGAAKVYDSIMSWWKTGKTVFNPGTHARNILGNVLFAQFAGIAPWNPANYQYAAEAYATLRDGGEPLKEMYEQGVLGGDFSNAELRAQLKTMLPAKDTIVGDMNTLTRVSMGLARAWAKTSGGIHSAYAFEDAIFKATAYTKAKAMGMSPEEAAQHVRKWFPYYDDIGTSFAIKGLKRTVFPFFSFYRESLRIFGNAAKERPLALAASMSVPYLITQFVAGLLGLDKEDTDQVLKDMRGKGKFLFRDTPIMSMLLPVRDAEGRLQQFDLSNVMPFADHIARKRDDSSERPWWQDLAMSTMAAGPIGSLGLSAATGRDTFSDRNIWEDDMTESEKGMQYAKHAWQILAPPLLPGGSSANMLADAGGRSTNKTLEKRNVSQSILRSLIGLDVRNAAPDLYRLAEDYRKEHNLPQDKNYAGGTTAQQRARTQLFAELAQDTPDVPQVARLLSFLKTSGAGDKEVPVDSPKGLNRLLFYKNPLMLLDGQEHQNRFRASLHGEARATLENALAEFRNIQARAPRVLAEARRLMIK